MKRLIVDVEKEINKYFAIYISLFCLIAIVVVGIKNIDLYGAYSNSVDTTIDNVKETLKKEYEYVVKNTIETEGDTYEVVSDYYDDFGILESFKASLKYYLPAIIIITGLILAFIQVGIINKFINKKDLIKGEIRVFKLNKVIAFLSIIVVISLFAFEETKTMYVFKVLENTHAILTFVLIVFGIRIFVSTLNAKDKKVNTITRLVTLIIILVMPSIFWFVGTWGSLTDIKIIKKMRAR